MSRVLPGGEVFRGLDAVEAGGVCGEGDRGLGIATRVGRAEDLEVVGSIRLIVATSSGQGVRPETV